VEAANSDVRRGGPQAERFICQVGQDHTAHGNRSGMLVFYEVRGFLWDIPIAERKRELKRRRTRDQRRGVFPSQFN